jgi:outer membrane immunogenic protein
MSSFLKPLVIASAAVSAFAAPALAGGPAVVGAEPEVVATAAPAKSVFDGFWIGGGLGYGSSNYEFGATASYHGDDVGGIDLPDLGGTGSLVTFQAGYGKVLNDKFVVGLQLDGTQSAITNDANLWLDLSGPHNDGGEIDLDYTMKPSTMVSLTGRLGLLTSPSTQFYGVLGVSRGLFKGAYDVSVEGSSVLAGDYTFGATGMVVGLGMETQISSHTTLGLEYRQTNFGTQTLFDGSIAEADLNAGIDTTVQTVRATVSYHF